jgi:hypothetical protein
MHQTAPVTAGPIPATPDANHEDNFETWLPGCQLIHILNVTSAPDLTAVNQVLACMLEDQQSVAAWRVIRNGTVFDQKISLQGISQSRARSVRERLSKLDKVLRISLEHQFRRIQPAR